MDVMGGLLTKGLGGPACCMLVTRFDLKLCRIMLFTGGYGGGGYRPMAPGQVQNFYKPIPYSQQNLNRSVEQFFKPFKPPVALKTIKIVVSFGTNENDPIYEKEYTLPKVKLSTVVKVANFANITSKDFKATVSNFRNSFVATTKIMVTKFKKKR